jgi:hypothetical protein
MPGRVSRTKHGKITYGIAVGDVGDGGKPLTLTARLLQYYDTLVLPIMALTLHGDLPIGFALIILVELCLLPMYISGIPYILLYTLTD